jgi:hypothetical protein
VRKCAGELLYFLGNLFYRGMILVQCLDTVSPLRVCEQQQRAHPNGFHYPRKCADRRLWARYRHPIESFLDGLENELG